MKQRMKIILSILASAMFTLFLYIVLHETGHMIVMLSAGARITEFSIFGAHVSSEGGNYTNLSDLWLHANGALLPLFVSYAYLLFYQKDWKNPFYRFFSLFFSVIPASSMIAWVIIPFAYMIGNAPAGDDVTNFLFNFSQSCSPVFVSIVALLLIGINIFLLLKKRVLQNCIESIKNMRQLLITGKDTSSGPKQSEESL